jgi:hypothetical protein
MYLIALELLPVLKCSSTSLDLRKVAACEVVLRRFCRYVVRSLILNDASSHYPFSFSPWRHTKVSKHSVVLIIFSRSEMLPVVV